MGLVKSLLEYKGKEVYKVNLNDSVFSALELLAKYDVGALVVVDKQEKRGYEFRSPFLGGCCSLTSDKPHSPSPKP